MPRYSLASSIVSYELRVAWEEEETWTKCLRAWLATLSIFLRTPDLQRPLTGTATPQRAHSRVSSADRPVSCCRRATFAALPITFELTESPEGERRETQGGGVAGPLHELPGLEYRSKP